MFFLFLLLAILAALEASTSLARAAGFSANSAYAGLTLQGSLSLISRFVIFLYSPIFGYLADTNRINLNAGSLVIYYYLLIPTALTLVYVYRLVFISIFLKLIQTSLDHGTWLKSPSLGYIKSAGKVLRQSKNMEDSKLRTKKFRIVNVCIFLIYTPYYAAWPVTFIAISVFPSLRATLISLTTVFTAVNTIGLVLWLDPLLLRMQSQGRASKAFLCSTIPARIYSSLFVFIILFFSIKFI